MADLQAYWIEWMAARGFIERGEDDRTLFIGDTSATTEAFEEMLSDFKAGKPPAP